MTPTKSDSPLTVPQVATKYGVNNATVRAWIAAGELCAVNVSRSARSKKPRWRITAAALAAFEEQRRPAPVIPQRRRRRGSASTERVFFK